VATGQDPSRYLLSWVDQPLSEPWQRWCQLIAAEQRRPAPLHHRELHSIRPFHVVIEPLEIGVLSPFAGIKQRHQSRQVHAPKRIILVTPSIGFRTVDLQSHVLFGALSLRSSSRGGSAFGGQVSALIPLRLLYEMRGNQLAKTGVPRRFDRITG